MLTDPQKLLEGHKWLQELRKAACPSFRVYTDYIREAIRKGSYTYGELGATEAEVLELAIGHAGNAARSGYPHDMALKNFFLCEQQKVRGAHALPPYATLVVNNEETSEEELKKAA
jgi:hypothetical protein